MAKANAPPRVVVDGVGWARPASTHLPRQQRDPLVLAIGPRGIRWRLQGHGGPEALHGAPLGQRLRPGRSSATAPSPRRRAAHRRRFRRSARRPALGAALKPWLPTGPMNRCASQSSRDREGAYGPLPESCSGAPLSPPGGGGGGLEPRCADHSAAPRRGRCGGVERQGVGEAWHPARGRQARRRRDRPCARQRLGQLVSLAHRAPSASPPGKRERCYTCRPRLDDRSWDYSVESWRSAT